ncbi:DUF2267 domain-containing protein [Haloplanus sp. GCM10025708]|uniref:DUF2267 domain-containing protein n=1 Tax=Haloferacaceae TaxID=1644056 RepID=UPI0036230ABE
MDANVFTEIVRQHGGFESSEDAQRTIAAVLEALSECIARGEAEDAAPQLPPEFAGHLLVDEQEEAAPLEFPAFLDRVSEESGFDREVALARAQAVILALYRALDEFEYESIRGQLPEEYGPLFDEDALAVEVTLSGALAIETDIPEEDARDATESVLETLGERLTLGEAEDVAAYLTEREAAALVDRESPDSAAFDGDEFVERVAEREGIDETSARDYAKRVVRALDSVAHDEMERAREQLGPNYAALFSST